jgi:hypothetical protein
VQAACKRHHDNLCVHAFVRVCACVRVGNIFTWLTKLESLGSDTHSLIRILKGEAPTSASRRSRKWQFEFNASCQSGGFKLLIQCRSFVPFLLFILINIHVPR